VSNSFFFFETWPPYVTEVGLEFMSHLLGLQAFPTTLVHFKPF
jgi:hypothetical protein